MIYTRKNNKVILVVILRMKLIEIDWISTSYLFYSENNASSDLLVTMIDESSTSSTTFSNLKPFLEVIDKIVFS